MANTLNNLGQGLIDNTAPTVIYTAAAGVKTTVLDWFICNESAADKTFTVWMYASGGAVAAGKKLFNGKTIRAYDTFHISTKLVMPVAGSIAGQCGEDATSVNITISGLEQS